jgi:NAD(P)-dependent dehydrogenase (short-subunit alcohol dehydrogenase family)
MGMKIDHLFSEGRAELIEKLHPLGLGEPNDVAHMCSFLLSDLSKWITGSIISVDGGFSAQ